MKIRRIIYLTLGIVILVVSVLALIGGINEPSGFTHSIEVVFLVGYFGLGIMLIVAARKLKTKMKKQVLFNEFLEENSVNKTH